MPQSRKNWSAIVEAARQIAASYTTPVTLRQLHYRLVAAGVSGYENDVYCYDRLSELTSEERRAGAFPRLADLTRGVDRSTSFADPVDALRWLAEAYRRDRTEGQQFQVWLLYEKATLSAQIRLWTDDYGLPSAALRGYSSESLEREVFEAMVKDGRAVVVFYVGDFDPEGEDIERNFVAQAARFGISFALWERLTVTPAQVTDLGLVPMMAKPKSSRAPAFVAKHGALFQVEVEAVDPVDLERFVVDAVTDPQLFDRDRWSESVDLESQERATLDPDDD